MLRSRLHPSPSRVPAPRASLGVVPMMAAQLLFLCATQADLAGGTAGDYDITAGSDFVATHLVMQSVKDDATHALGDNLQDIGITDISYDGINFLVSATNGSPFPAAPFHARFGGMGLMRDGLGLLIKSGSTLRVSANVYSDTTINDVFSVGVLGYLAEGSPVQGSNSSSQARKFAALAATALAAGATSSPQLLAQGVYQLGQIWMAAEDSSAPAAGESHARGSVLSGVTLESLTHDNIDHVLAGGMPAELFRYGQAIGQIAVSGAEGPTFGFRNDNAAAINVLVGAELF